MAYVRRRGNQLSIVTGERDPATQKVEQRVLFTLYSRPEALEMLGRGADPSNAHRFEKLLEHEHPDIRFEWSAIRGAIAADLDHLPETYEYKEMRLAQGFHESLVSFARALVLADPQDLVSSGALIREHREQLRFVQELVDWRLATCAERETNEWNADNPFFWRFALQGRQVPPDAEELASGFFEKRDLARAEGAFRVLAGAFPGYAEGWNYLGLIALERGDLAAAERCFKTTIELGRALFPKRLRAKTYWTDHRTRPYMRGLRNLAQTLLRAARYDEVSVLANRLETECGDVDTVTSLRADVAMNTGDWASAAECAARLGEVWPADRLIEAFARFERGELRTALAAFLRGALSNPMAARIVLGAPSADPRSALEAEDHNAGVHLLHALHGYLGTRSQRARRFFRRVLRDERVADLVMRVERLRASWSGNPKAERSVFDELTRLQSEAFAQSQVDVVADLLGSADGSDQTALARETPRARRPSSGGDRLH